MNITVEGLAAVLGAYLKETSSTEGQRIEEEKRRAQLWRDIVQHIVQLKNAATRPPLDEEAVPGGSRCQSAHASSVAVTLLTLLELLLRPTCPAMPAARVRPLLRFLEIHLRRHPAHCVRQSLPLFFSRLGRLRLGALANPLGTARLPPGGGPPAGSGSEEPLFDDQWVDVGLLGLVEAAPNPQEVFLEERVLLIPFSVFSRRFFYEVLPSLMEEADGERSPEPARAKRAPTPGRHDDFYYLRENDQALCLRERYPHLRKLPCENFQYFIGETGLAEIVLDTPLLGARALRLASHLFCLRNGVTRALLHGRNVAGRLDLGAAEGRRE